MLEWQYFGSDFEICVIVEQRHVMSIGKGGDENISHADDTVTTSAGQPPLRIQRRLPVFVVGGLSMR
jgi:hypothetical protein